MNTQLDDNYIRNEINYLKQQISNIQNQLDGKSNTDHLHDGRYYTEWETDSLLSNKSNNNHDHINQRCRSGSDVISFNWLYRDGSWKIDVYINGQLVRSNW